MRPDALVPTNALVQPTPVYELLFSLVLAWWLWQRGKKQPAVGVITGEYLVWSGLGRFLVEFVRLNPRLYLGMSNAQVAAIGSVVVGFVLIGVARSRGVQWMPELASDSRT
jgi:phosphatidylglycerol:prolipoprotein diacylglycerol transferase